MSQGTTLSREQVAPDLTKSLVRCIDDATAYEEPFHHIRFDHVFPEDFYRRLRAALPVAADYRPMSGRSRDVDPATGQSLRMKIDLFPEYIRFLPPDKRDIWNVVGRALCSNELRAAFLRRLAPGLERRFGKDFATVGFFPIPVLTRDICGYQIAPHTDTHWKGITVLLFLPGDRTMEHVGTVVHEQLRDGGLRRAGQVPFAPNSGFAFAVGDNTWHSVDPVGGVIETRDLVILQYFVDSGLLRILRNRGKRFGNFVLNEARNLAR